ncbi:early nodulin-like protein 2 [Lycium ferocissimum]|uniref:early nodulin-like protein 2 n=1 Tax=Lycium ferocissimum TaxID=112874 RepID=UPI0028150695|nr:early nodulin-like protein 2 [Lycium ferocissimum]
MALSIYAICLSGSSMQMHFIIFLLRKILNFIFLQDGYSVLEVNKDDYDKCNTENPIKKMEDGNSVFKFDRSGPFYFISSNKGKCKEGQKMAIVVLAVRPQPPSPAPEAHEGSSTHVSPSPKGDPSSDSPTGKTTVASPMAHAPEKAQKGVSLVPTGSHSSTTGHAPGKAPTPLHVPRGISLHPPLTTHSPGVAPTLASPVPTSSHSSPASSAPEKAPSPESSHVPSSSHLAPTAHVPTKAPTPTSSHVSHLSPMAHAPGKVPSGVSISPAGSHLSPAAHAPEKAQTPALSHVSQSPSSHQSRAAHAPAKTPIGASPVPASSHASPIAHAPGKAPKPSSLNLPRGIGSQSPSSSWFVIYE